MVHPTKRIAVRGETPCRRVAQWKGESHILGTGIYPITIAEMQNYTSDADRYFEFEEHERLKDFLALHPESGRVLADTGGVRVLQWPINGAIKSAPARIVYYFRDLNMPLYLLALYELRERIPLDARWRKEIRTLVEQLVAEHSEKWATILVRQLKGGKELA